MEMKIDGALGLIGCDAPREAEGDYTGEDGLLYCGKCRTRKQRLFKLPEALGGSERVVWCMCECASKKAREDEARRQHAERMRKLDELRSASLMDAMYRECTFGNSRVVDDNRKQFDMARRYAERFDEMFRLNRGLMFYGPPGTGKTHIAACIANELLGKGVSVLMTSFVKLLGTSMFRGDDNELIDRMEAAQLLIIDDLGAERGSDYALERVYNFIDSRVRSSRPMILTTNLTVNQMRGTEDIRYKRIYDRVFQACFPVALSGASFRQKAAKQMYEEMTEMLGGY